MSDIRIDFSRLKETVNDVYWPLLHVPTRFLVLYGGAGSGKSVFAAQKVLHRICTEKGHRYACIRKVARTLRNSVFALLCDLIKHWGQEKHWEVNKSEMKLVFKPNGNEILCLGLDEKEKIKSIHGITSLWCEEPTELTSGELRELDRRLRGQTPHYKQVILSFNPIDKSHWLRKMFFDEIEDPPLGLPFGGSWPGSLCLRTTYKHNQFIDNEYEGQMEGLKGEDLQEYRIYAKGEWGVLAGLIYSPPEIGFMPEGIKTTTLYGLDFGFTDPACLVELNVDLSAGKLYIDEILYESKLTNPELIKKTKNALLDRRCGIIYADSAEPDRIREGRVQHGLLVRPCLKGPGSVNMGIDVCKRYTWVVTPSSQNVLNEVSSYRWKVARNGETLPEPVGKRDHSMAAIRYPMFTRFGRSRGIRVPDRSALGF